MWSIASSSPSTTRTAMMASRYSVDQSSSLADFTLESARCVSGSPLTSQPASISVSTSGTRWVGAAARSTSSVSAAAAHAGPPHLGVEHDGLRHGGVGWLMHIDVTDAFEMREHRHARLLLHAGDEAFAAARHDHVDGAAEPGEHESDRLALHRRHELDRCLRQSCLGEALGQRIADHERGEEALRAAAQDHGVA